MLGPLITKPVKVARRLGSGELCPEFALNVHDFSLGGQPHNVWASRILGPYLCEEPQLCGQSWRVDSESIAEQRGAVRVPKQLAQCISGQQLAGGARCRETRARRLISAPKFYRKTSFGRTSTCLTLIILAWPTAHVERASALAALTISRCRGRVVA